MILTIAEILLILIVPALVLRFSRTKLVKLLGPVAFCYVLGLLFGLIPLDFDKSIAMTVSEVAIPLAIPLVLFSAKLSESRKLAKPVLLSFAILTVSVTAVSFGAYFVFRGSNENAGILASMAAGLYTGGTPNLFAIGKSFGLDEAILNLSNAADIIIGGVFYLILLTVAKPVLGWFLNRKNTRKTESYVTEETNEAELTQEYAALRFPEGKKKRLRLLYALLLDIGVLAVVAGIALLATGELNVIIVMLGVTTAGIGFSFVRPVRETEGTYLCGQYLILLFSFALSFAIDLSNFAENFLPILLFFGSVTVVAALVHILLSRLFRLDRDITMVTMTAGLYGPAFITPICAALKNEKLTVPGLVCGILGYAIGTYLGLLIGLIIV